MKINPELEAYNIKIENLKQNTFLFLIYELISIKQIQISYISYNENQYFEHPIHFL